MQSSTPPVASSGARSLAGSWVCSPWQPGGCGREPVGRPLSASERLAEPWQQEERVSCGRPFKSGRRTRPPPLSARSARSPEARRAAGSIEGTHREPHKGNLKIHQIYTLLSAHEQQKRLVDFLKIFPKLKIHKRKKSKPLIYS